MARMTQVLCAWLLTLSHLAWAETKWGPALNAVRHEDPTIYEGTLSVLMVDFLPPKEPETWYYLHLSQGRGSIKLKMSDHLAALPSISSGVRVRARGTMVETAVLEEPDANLEMVVSHIEAVHL